MEWTDIDILLKLLFSHILVDFVLQTNKIVRKKKEKRGFYHLLHSLSQAVVAYLIVGQWEYCKEIKTTEYVMIGTLASFTIAILIGLILNQLSL